MNVDSPNHDKTNCDWCCSHKYEKTYPNQDKYYFCEECNYHTQCSNPQHFEMSFDYYWSSFKRCCGCKKFKCTINCLLRNNLKTADPLCKDCSIKSLKKRKRIDVVEEDFQQQVVKKQKQHNKTIYLQDLNTILSIEKIQEVCDVQKPKKLTTVLDEVGFFKSSEYSYERIFMKDLLSVLTNCQDDQVIWDKDTYVIHTPSLKKVQQIINLQELELIGHLKALQILNQDLFFKIIGFHCEDYLFRCRNWDVPNAVSHYPEQQFVLYHPKISFHMLEAIDVFRKDAKKNYNSYGKYKSVLHSAICFDRVEILKYGFDYYVEKTFKDYKMLFDFALKNTATRCLDYIIEQDSKCLWDQSIWRRSSKNEKFVQDVYVALAKTQSLELLQVLLKHYSVEKLDICVCTAVSYNFGKEIVLYLIKKKYPCQTDAKWANNVISDNENDSDEEGEIPENGKLSFSPPPEIYIRQYENKDITCCSEKMTQQHFSIGFLAAMVKKNFQFDDGLIQFLFSNYEKQIEKELKSHYSGNKFWKYTFVESKFLSSEFERALLYIICNYPHLFVINFAWSDLPRLKYHFGTRVYPHALRAMQKFK